MSDSLQIQKQNLAKKQKELAQQLAQINKEIQEAKQKEQAAADVFYVEHAKNFLKLIPNHNGRDCSDEKQNTYNNKCLRCFLLQADRMGYWESDYDIEIALKPREQSNDY